MKTRHPKHDSMQHIDRRIKGSSETRLNVELNRARRGKQLLRQRGNKKLYAQPRRLIDGSAPWTGKWSLEDLKHMRRIKGVGRPPIARHTPEPPMGILERWGF
jgi:hypothetical protein